MSTTAAPTRSSPTPPTSTTTTASAEGVALVIWRQHLIASLWRPGRQNAPSLRVELRRVECALLDHYWPRWREVM
jgi:hypothetical protein